MQETLIQLNTLSRAALVKGGRRLEHFTIAYNRLEGLIAILVGLWAGSIALVGFGVDSVIEVTSGAALLWRLYADAHEERREQVERVALSREVLRLITINLSTNTALPVDPPHVTQNLL